MADESNDNDSGGAPNTPKGLFDHFNARLDRIEKGMSGGGDSSGDDDPDHKPKPDPKPDDQPNPAHGWWDKPLFGG